MNFLPVTLIVTFHVLSSYAQFPPMAYPNQMQMGMPAMSMPGMPMQMPMIGPPQMPSVIMPYHSKKADNLRKKPKKPRRRKPRYKSESYSSSSSCSSSGSSESSSSVESSALRTSKDGLKKRRQVLTPVISYVTKDGYVVYEKKIKKDRAKDWLDLGKNSGPNGVRDDEAEQKDEELEDKIREKLEKMKNEKHRSKRKRHHHH